MKKHSDEPGFIRRQPAPREIATTAGAFRARAVLLRESRKSAGQTAGIL